MPNIFRDLSPDSPNLRQYELRYADGDAFRWRNQKTFSLPGAVQMADHMAGTGIKLYVTDPETGTVLWEGMEVMR